MASQDGSGSSDDDDYDMHQPGLEQRARYPIHDCCEFEDAETLRVSPLVPVVVVSIVESIVHGPSWDGGS